MQLKAHTAALQQLDLKVLSPSFMSILQRDNSAKLTSTRDTNHQWPSLPRHL